MSGEVDHHRREARKAVADMKYIHRNRKRHRQELVIDKHISLATQNQGLATIEISVPLFYGNARGYIISSLISKKITPIYPRYFPKKTLHFLIFPRNMPHFLLICTLK